MDTAIDARICVARKPTQASYRRTAAGAEMDLVLDMGAKHGLWAIEIKRSAAAAVSKGFHISLDDIQPRRGFAVHGEPGRYPKRDGVEAIGLVELLGEVAQIAKI